MDNFYGEPPRQLPEGWSPFAIFGDPAYVNDPHSVFGTGTLRIMSNNGAPLKAGIYTQVQVTAGAGYRASIAWGAPNAPTDVWGRQLGVDPTGGTDPNSPNVIWGSSHYGDGRILNYSNGDGPNIDLRVRAANSTVTVFFLTDLTHVTSDNLIYIDVISLFPDESAPPVAQPAATNTPPPPAPAPQTEAAVGAAAAPVQQAQVAIIPPPPTPTTLPTDTATPLPTDTPTAPPTATLPPTQTALPSPTWTPWPTSVSVSRFDLRQMGRQLLGSNSGQGGSDNRQPLLWLSGLSFAGAAVFGGSLWWMRRRP